jgi:hypothetical protein
MIDSIASHFASNSWAQMDQAAITWHILMFSALGLVRITPRFWEIERLRPILASARNGVRPNANSSIIERRFLIPSFRRETALIRWCKTGMSFTLVSTKPRISLMICSKRASLVCIYISRIWLSLRLSSRRRFCLSIWFRISVVLWDFLLGLVFLLLLSFSNRLSILFLFGLDIVEKK